MTIQNESKSFELGILTITPAAEKTLHPEDVFLCLFRHGGGDWGDCTREDAEENNFSVDKELRILSVYHDRNGQKFWIITEADRSAKTVLLPEDY